MPITLRLVKINASFLYSCVYIHTLKKTMYMENFLNLESGCCEQPANGTSCCVARESKQDGDPCCEQPTDGSACCNK